MPSERFDRLERVIAHKGLASRREAKDFIGKGLVTVNGVVITEPGFGINPISDAIVIEGIQSRQSILVYKARGIETTKTTPSAKDLHDTFKKYKHLSPVGRLDKESEGLIIMTNDGTLTKALTKEASRVGKTYLVTVRENVPDASIRRMSRGILLDTRMTKPAIVTRKSRTSFTITLYEGQKHQIRRMCDTCHLTIISLVRISIGHLSVDTMKPGSVRLLTQSDIDLLKST